MPGSVSRYDSAREDAGDEDLNNQSGDTFLVTSDDENVSYADKARKRFESIRPVEHPEIASTWGEHLGADRYITEFEKEHFLPDNMTPDRPCTAYFTAENFIDSAVVFRALDIQEYPKTAVRCLQRKPTGKMLITFANPELREAFVHDNPIRVRNRQYVAKDDDSRMVFLNIYDAPNELPDSAICLRLSKYCNVISMRRGKYANRGDVFNSMRHYRVRLIDDIPSYLRFGKFLIRLSHDGQQHTCRKCNRNGHFANECHNEVCFNCDDIGHVSRNCPGNIKCSICKSESHMAHACPHSWFRSRSPQTSNTDDT